MSSEDKILDTIDKKYKGRDGILCTFCLIQMNQYNELNDYATEHKIPIKPGISTKVGFFKTLVSYYYELFDNNKELKKEYGDFLTFLGDKLLEDDRFQSKIKNFDFISKQELIDIFSDFCADLGINVYTTEKMKDYSLDLYLIRRTPLLRTESVMVLTGNEMELPKYEETLNILEKSSKIATWLVFVTTPYGAYKIGIKKLIEDMERLGIWLYIVNPLHKRILGVTKGKKSKDHDTDLRDAYIQGLPREPIRAPSKIIKISKYLFNEGASYKSKNFMTYELWSDNDIEEMQSMREDPPKYKDIFLNFLVIDRESGLTMFSYSSEESKVDDGLISGFLSAMDSFVSELGGGTALKEINYKGFIIQAAYGENIKMALFLTKSGDKVLKERLEYFIREFEEKYQTEIQGFKQTGDVGAFHNNPIIINELKKTLDI